MGILKLGLSLASGVVFALYSCTGFAKGVAQKTSQKPVAETDGKVAVSEELHDGVAYLRIRVNGEAALNVCRFLGIDLTKVSPGYTEDLPNKKSGLLAATCFKDGKKGSAGAGLGFLVDKQSKTFGLEAFGYD